MGLLDNKAIAAQGVGLGERTAGGPFSKKLSPIKTARDMLANDLDTLQNNPEELGLTGSQMEAQRSDAQADADARANAQISSMERTSLAGQGFQQGAFSEASRAVSDDRVDAGVGATAAAHEANRELIARESARIRGELDAARARAKLFGKQAAQATGQAAGAVLSYGSGAINEKLGGGTA